MVDNKNGASDKKSEETVSLWQTIEKKMEKNEDFANQMAIIEAEKIFRKTVKDKNLPGKDLEDSIKNYRDIFHNSDKLQYARATCEKIISEPGFEISSHDAEEIIGAYREAIDDLENADFGNLPVKEKLEFFLGRHFYSFPRKIKIAIGIIIAVCTATFLLTETETGKSAAAYWVKINNYFFYEVLPVAAEILIVLLFILILLFLYKNKSKNGNKDNRNK